MSYKMHNPAITALENRAKFDIGTSWKDVIFLPFHWLVSYTFMVATYCSLMYSIFLITYKIKTIPFLLYIFLCILCEIVYFLIMVLLILHRLMKTHRQRMIYNYSPLLLIMVDFVSIFPLGSLYVTINSYTWENHFTEDQLTYDPCYLKLVRIFRLLFFYYELRRNMTNNQRLVIIMCHFLGSFVVIFSIGSVYYYCGLNPPSKLEPTWMNTWTKKINEVDDDNALRWFVISTYEVAGLYFNNAMRVLKYTNMHDTMLVSLAMLIGFISQYTFLLGTLTSEEVQIMRPKYNLLFRLNDAKKLMTTLIMPEHLQKTVHAYYETIWNCRFGVVSTPTILHKLPPYMQSEIQADIFWEALRHTKIFNNATNVFKRTVAEIMKVEIHLQGYYVFKDKDIKAKLVYLQSGMMEISTMRAGDSRITLTSGSVICEMACIQMMRCNANVKCLTNCTLHVLYMTDFYKALLKHHKTEFKKMRMIYKQRLLYCRNKLQIVGKKMRMSHMQWVKTQWRDIFEKKQVTYDSNFTSRFLNLISIIDLKMNPEAFCLRGNCPFVMIANTPLQQMFYYLTLFATLLNFFMTFEDIFFEGHLDLENYKYYVLIDVVFFLDIYIQSITSIKTSDFFIEQAYDIFVYKLKTVWFVCDLIATVPGDYIVLILGVTGRSLGYFRLNRYLRLYKIIQYFHYNEERITSFALFIKLCQFVIYHTLIGLILTCAVYLCNCIGDECHPNGFLELLKKRHIRLVGSKIAISNFFICLYYTINIYLKLILRVYEQFYIPDILMKVVIIILSYYITTIKLANACATFGLRYENDHFLQEHVELIDIHVKENKALKKYKHRLLECLTAEWSISRDLRFNGLCKVTYQESEFLRRNVNDEYIMWNLEQTNFFKPFPKDLLLHISHRSSIYLIPQGHDLVKFETRCFYLYIIVHGFCARKSYAAGDEEMNNKTFYKRLDVFPLLEYLHQIDSLMDVCSHTAVQLITIPYSVFRASISIYHFEMTILQNALRGHMNQFGNSLQRANNSTFLCKDREICETMKPKMFEYKIRRQKLILDITNSSLQQSRNSAFFKYRKILKLISLSTYSPNSYWYMVYEIFRCICILVQVNLTQFLCIAYVYQSTWTCWATRMFTVLWVADMLIQAHLVYYNEDGILVHSLKATAKHYFKNSFLVGLLAGLPYEWFQLSKFAKKDRQFTTEIIILLNARMLFLVRPFMLFQYFGGNSVKRLQKIVKYFTIIIGLHFSVLYLAGMKLLLTCNIDAQRNYECPEHSWIFMRTVYLKWDQSKFYWISVKSVFSAGVSVADGVSLWYDHIITMAIGIIMVTVRVTILSKVTGDSCVRRTRLVKHQDALKRYHNFFRSRFVSNSTKNEMMLHYKNIWQKSYSEKSQKMFENIYPLLREKIFLAMYKSAVSRCVLFKEKNNVLFKLFIPHMEERYYCKDAIIIRPNDVQGNIFIIVKGLVEMSVAECRLAVLGAGGLFGCFESMGLNRHTMKAKAIQHTKCLVIKSTRLNQLIKGFHKAECLMKSLQKTQFQYASLGSRKLDLHNFAESIISTRSMFLEAKYIKTYKIFMYVTNMHIAPLSAYLVLVNCQIEYGVMTFLPLWIILDVYFGVCFILRGRFPIEDFKTGGIISRPKDLQRYYLKSFFFPIDCLSILPIYLIRIWIHANIHQIWFLLNKLLRLYFLLAHYQTYVLAKNIPRHIQWTLLVYSTFFLAQLIFIIWWFILELPYEEKITSKYFVLGYIIMMNYVSHSGLKIFLNSNPTYSMQITIDLVLIIMSTCLTLALASFFTKSVLSGNYYECVYRYRARYCKRFCKSSNVSISLVSRIWNYLHLLYKKQGGEQFPSLYTHAPKYLKQDHMSSLFGKHFNDHPLFYDLHVDLLKQIQTHIKCNYFVPGSVIVEKGTKNGQFYFIEMGTVLAIQALSNEDSNPMYEKLGPGKAFGEFQAFLNLEHQRTYQALTYVDVIAITVSDWEYLLNWFPASKEKLLGRIQEHAELLKYN